MAGAVSIASYAQRTTTLRCEGKLVTLGDSKRTVEAVCGLPSFVDVSHVEKTVREYEKFTADHHVKDRTQHASPDNIEKDYDFVQEHTESIDREKWTYNFGPSRFTQTLMFENNRLCSIETGGYGYSKDVTTSPHVQIGDSKAIVMMKYGKPADTYKRSESETLESYDRVKGHLSVKFIKKPVDHEEWVYDFGPDRFQEKLVFVADHLVNVEKLKDRGLKK